MPPPQWFQGTKSQEFGHCPVAQGAPRRASQDLVAVARGPLGQQGGAGRWGELVGWLEAEFAASVAARKPVD